MPFQCTSCGVNLGGETRDNLCEFCRAMLTLPSDQPERPSPINIALPAPRSLSLVQDFNWGMMRFGIDMLFISALSQLIGQLVLYVLQAIQLVVPAGPLVELYMASSVVIGIVFVVSGLCALVSLFFCCALPAESRSRNLAVATRIGLITSLLLALLMAFLIPIVLIGRPTNLPAVIFVMAFSCGLPLVLVALASWVMLVLVFSGVSRELGNKRLASRFIEYLIVSLVFTLLQAVVTVILLRILGPNLVLNQKVPVGMEEAMLQLRGYHLFMPLIGVGLLIWFLVLLNSLGWLLTSASQQKSSATP